jgi:hypothetical protein
VRPWKGRGLGAREIWIWEGGGQGSGKRKSRGSTNRGDQTPYGVAISLPRGREQLLDHGSKPLEGAPPATEYRSDVTLFLALVVGTSASGHTMRDLPGFVWDEERQRYFALQSEPVARSLQQ